MTSYHGPCIEITGDLVGKLGKGYILFKSNDVIAYYANDDNFIGDDRNSGITINGSKIPEPNGITYHGRRIWSENAGDAVHTYQMWYRKDPSSEINTFRVKALNGNTVSYTNALPPKSNYDSSNSTDVTLFIGCAYIYGGGQNAYIFGTLNSGTSYYGLDLIPTGTDVFEVSISSTLNVPAKCLIYLLDSNKNLTPYAAQPTITFGTTDDGQQLTIRQQNNGIQIFDLIQGKSHFVLLVPGTFVLAHNNRSVVPFISVVTNKDVFSVASDNIDTSTTGIALQYKNSETGSTNIINLAGKPITRITTVNVILEMYVLNGFTQYTVEFRDTGLQYASDQSYLERLYQRNLQKAKDILDMLQKVADVAKTSTEALKNITSSITDVAKLAAV